MGEQKLSPINWSETRSGSSWARWPGPIRTVAGAAPGGVMAASLLLLTPAIIGSATGLPAMTGPPNAPSSGAHSIPSAATALVLGDIWGLIAAGAPGGGLGRIGRGMALDLPRVAPPTSG